MKQTCSGSCHCGAVRFEADIDFGKGTVKCNCSICTKSRAWVAIIPPEAFRLVQGESELSGYRFGRMTVHHCFCRHCGIHTFARGFHEAVGREFYTVPVSCLDEVSIGDVFTGQVYYSDGRNDNPHQAPSEVSHL